MEAADKTRVFSEEQQNKSAIVDSGEILSSKKFDAEIEKFIKYYEPRSLLTYILGAFFLAISWILILVGMVALAVISAVFLLALVISFAAIAGPIFIVCGVFSIVYLIFWYCEAAILTCLK